MPKVRSCFSFGCCMTAALSCSLVCAGFMKSLGVYGTGNLGRITASLCAKVCADWLLSEFEDLSQILASVSDNTAVMACESIMAILAHEGCSELDRIGDRDYVFPEPSELEEDTAKV